MKLSACVLLFGLLTSSCQSLKFAIAALVMNRQKMPQELATGMKPVFTALPSGWVSPLKQNMNSMWQDLHVQGMNYFTLGKPQGLAGYAARSNYRSPYYQAWCGVYVVEAKKNVLGYANAEFNRDPDKVKQFIQQLAEHDQKTWLRVMGDPAAQASTRSLQAVGRIEVAGQQHPLYEGVMLSHSDLTAKQTELAKLVGFPAAKYWAAELDQFHPVVLTGFYTAWYDADYQAIVVIYANGSSFQTKSGESFNYYPQIKQECLQMAQGIRLQKAD